MPTRNVNLTDHFDSFVEERVLSGEFKNASEVVRAGLRLLEHAEQERLARLDRLRAEVQHGVDAADRGEVTAVPIDQIDAFVASLRRRADRRRT